MKTTLILMPCSATKLAHAEQPRRLYLGPMWQTLRTHIGAFPWTNVFVLSGKYGFLGALHFIQTYDARLTPEKAQYLIDRGIHAPQNDFGATASGPSAADIVRPPAHAGRPPFARVFVAGAGEYRRVFDTYIPQLIDAAIIARAATIEHVAGGIGEQRAQLGAFLRSASR